MDDAPKYGDSGDISCSETTHGVARHDCPAELTEF